ncbi:MAG: putative 4,5-dihydroxyphthalate dehydrogenase [Pseudomonadota bacterium]
MTTNAGTASTRPLRIAIVGFGAAAQAFVPAIKANSQFELAAIVENNAHVQTAAQMLGVPVFNQLSELQQVHELDGVYIATPTPCHADQAIEALSLGWHVLVEKPMACNATEALRMVTASKQFGKSLTVGHSHSFDAPIQTMKHMIESGELGAIQMVNTWCFTDWVYRPRRPEELSPSLGGGVTFRQGAHQIDILRALCGDKVQTVKGKVFNSDPQRNTHGAHAIYLDFKNGAAGTAIYNGYAGLSSMDWTGNVSEWGFHQSAASRPWKRRPTALASDAQELKAKQERAKTAIPGAAPLQPHFGLTVVSCALGDMRQTPEGLLIATASGDREIKLPSHQSPRDLVLLELEQAWRGLGQHWHDGQWGYENIRICEAAIASAQSGREWVLSD